MNRKSLIRIAATAIGIILFASACGDSGSSQQDSSQEPAATTASGGEAAPGSTEAPSTAPNEALCGLGSGEEATGDPILLGGITGATGGDDFSSGTDAAAAYFRCVNANGGINGRPVEYIVEDDEWNPEVANQVATKLISDDEVVALVGNSSFVEMAVNASLYAENDVVSVPAACAVRECFESSNMSSTNAGPYPSNNGVVQYAFDELGTENVACVGLNIPSNGVWSCEAAVQVAVANGGAGTFVPLDPASPDCLGALLEATSGDADTVLMNLPAGLSICMFAAAEEQDLRDSFSWISPTPLYDLSSPEALGPYWDGVVYIQIELTLFDGTGPDNLAWKEVMSEYGNADDPLDTFSQAGFLSAKIVTDVLLGMDSANIDRASVTEAITGVERYDSDLRCSPWYFGPGDVHQSNHSGQIVRISGGGFEKVQDCFVSPGDFIDDVLAFEAANGLGASAAENFGS